MFHGWRALSSESGQTAVEYAGAIALVAVLFVLGITGVPHDLFTSFWAAVQSALS